MKHPSSLYSYLEAVRPDLSAALLDREGWRRLREAAERLPPTSLAGFEVRLGDPRPAADFAAGFRPAEPAAAALASNDRPAGHPAWDRLASFLAAAREGALADRIDCIWIELDLADAPAEAAPNLLFGLRRRAVAEEGAPALLAAALAAAGRPLDAALAGAVELATRGLPAAAWAFQAGLMLARPLPVVRLCITDLTREGAESLLGRWGWSLPAGDPSAPVAALAGEAEQLVLALDLGGDRLLRAGFELYPDAVRRPRLTPAWERLLDRLAAAGLCTAAKRDALAAWPGVTSRHSAGGAWPANLERVGGLLRGGGGRREPVLLRGINHLKVSWTPAGVEGVKAYFGLRQELIGAERLAALVPARAAV